MSPPRLAIDNLSVRIGGIDAVRDVSLSIAPGQIFGVAGESGSGKSMTALAVMGLLPDGAHRGGAARLDGEDLFALDEAAMCGVRGRRIGMIFQEPMTALNPVRTIGAQVAETLVIHAGMSPSEEREIADVIWIYGEERASRRVARAITRGRPFETTAALAEAVRSALPPRGRDQIDPATRSFQAIRIHVNDELGELERGLEAAEATLAPGGRLAVVTFHSLEDRIVKAFLTERTGNTPAGSRHAPIAVDPRKPSFALQFKGAREAGEAERAANPRARSAKLRAAIRTEAPAWAPEKTRMAA